MSDLAKELENMPGNKVSKSFKQGGAYLAPAWGTTEGEYTYSDDVKVNTQVCVLDFSIETDLSPPVLFYYRLTNFYQNHRRYVKSFDVDQLKGVPRTVTEIDAGECDPLKAEGTGADRKPYYPCGLIANSMFNDTFVIPKALNPGSGQPPNYPMTEEGIAWAGDRDLYKTTTYKADQILPPPNWQKRYPNGYNDSRGIPNLETWEQFQVWMRTAGLPTFSKLAMRNDKDTMRAGRYRIVVWDNFPVTMYGGTKSILISTRTVMGGKNPFLGIAYIVVGGLCIVLGALFTATHLIRPRKLGDHTYLTWNNDQPSTATATGRSTHD